MGYNPQGRKESDMTERLHTTLMALGWWLVSVYVWRLLDSLLLLNVPCSQEFSGVLRFWA